MSTRKLLTVLLALIHRVQPAIPVRYTHPEPPAATEAPLPTPTSQPGLTLEQLQNAQVRIAGNSGPDAVAIKTVQLTNGRFESTADRSSPDYANVSMGPQVAYGDLNGDGLQDAAIIIGENYGGTGNFVSVTAMLNQNGQPVFAGFSMIDDRPAINAISIENGEIILDAVIHGPNDPGCCPAQPVKKSLRLWGGNLIQTRHTSKTADGKERMIKIESPAQASTVSESFTITGSVTIAPFENSLGCSVFIEGDPEPVAQSAIMVSASEMGGPGTFNLPLDLTGLNLKGKPLRLQINDFSPADGSPLAIATLFFTIQ